MIEKINNGENGLSIRNKINSTINTLNNTIDEIKRLENSIVVPKIYSAFSGSTKINDGYKIGKDIYTISIPNNINMIHIYARGYALGNSWTTAAINILNNGTIYTTTNSYISSSTTHIHISCFMSVKENDIISITLSTSGGMATGNGIDKLEIISIK